MTLISLPWQQTKMPTGYRMQYYLQAGSTNDVCLDLVQSIDQVANFSPIWLRARQQELGRGSQGRHWVSDHIGNLYASLLFQPRCQDHQLSHISIIAALALYDTLTLLGASGLILKWPNDIMVGDQHKNKKLAGILVELRKHKATQHQFAVIGTGVNVTLAPKMPDRETACLADMGLEVSSSKVLELLAVMTDEWLKQWAGGKNFDHIVYEWLKRADIMNKRVYIQGSGVQDNKGLCLGLNDQAQLVVAGQNGQHNVIDFHAIKQIHVLGA